MVDCTSQAHHVEMGPVFTGLSPYMERKEENRQDQTGHPFPTGNGIPIYPFVLGYPLFMGEKIFKLIKELRQQEESRQLEERLANAQYEKRVYFH